MAINKVEGIFGDMVVIYIAPDWYGIPFGQLVQTEAVVDYFGLQVTRITLQDDDILGNTCEVTDADILADRIVQLRNRFIGMGGDHVKQVKMLIDRFPAQFAAILASSLIP